MLNPRACGFEHVNRGRPPRLLRHKCLPRPCSAFSGPPLQAPSAHFTCSIPAQRPPEGGTTPNASFGAGRNVECGDEVTALDWGDGRRRADRRRISTERVRTWRRRPYAVGALRRPGLSARMRPSPWSRGKCCFEAAGRIPSREDGTDRTDRTHRTNRTGGTALSYMSYPSYRS